MNASTWRRTAERLLNDLLDSFWEFGDWCLAADELDLVDERSAYLNADPRFEGTELAHYAYVAERIPPDRRREMPWSFHEAVARLPEQYQDTLLDLAELEEWTLQELRRATRETIKELTE